MFDVRVRECVGVVVCLVVLDARLVMGMNGMYLSVSLSLCVCVCVCGLDWIGLDWIGCGVMYMCNDVMIGVCKMLGCVVVLCCVVCCCVLYVTFV